jgi:hypothetical protein
VDTVTTSHPRGLLAGLTAAALALTMTGIAPVAGQEPDVHIEVDIVANMIIGFGFSGPVTVKVDGGDPGGEIEYDEGSFTLYLHPEWSDDIDLEAPQSVEVSDGTTTKSVTLAALALTGWDFAANTLSGTTNQEANVLARAWNATGAGFTQASPTGPSWTVDFDLGDDQHDLRVVDSLEVQQFDEDGDATTVTGVAAGPRFVVGLEVQEVQGLDWPAGSSVTLTIDTPPLGSVDWTGTTTPGDPQSNWLYGTSGQGGAYFDLNATSTQVRPGDVLTMSDGTTTKVLDVPPLTTDVPDVHAEVVSGTATLPADSFLTVVGDGNWTHAPQHEATVTDGAWSASFAGDADYSMADTVPYAWITDLDGDTAESMAPRPQVWIDPSTDRIWALDIGEVGGGADVTLELARAGTQVFTDTVTPENLLTRGSWNLDMWATPAGSLARPAVALFDLSRVHDVQGGDVVTVTDGEVARTVTVAHLTVDGANPATEIVSGTADPGSDVGLHLGDGEGGYWGYEATPDTSGAWSYYFDPDHFASPPGGLSVGMSGQAIVRPGTVVRWMVSAGPTDPSEIIPLVVALPLTNQVERGLIGKLTSAQSAYDTGRTATGTRLMTSFISSVNGLSPKKISATDAAELVAAAQQVIAAHGG